MRRPLWTRFRVGGGLGLLAVVALAACGGGGGTTTTPTPSASAAVGGTMNIGVAQKCKHLLPQITTALSVCSWDAAGAAEGLLWYRSIDETQTAKSLGDYYRPDLATEVPTVENGDVKTSGCANPQAKMCVTWKLQPGVKWHDGTDFSSKDVCATFDLFWLHYLGHETDNPTALAGTAGWDQVIKCDASSPLRAVVDYKSTYGAYLANATGVMGILPAKYIEPDLAANQDIEKANVTVDLRTATGNPEAFNGTSTLKNLVIGTGPYVFSSITPDQTQITLVRNHNYWDKTRQPHLDKIVYKVFADRPSMLNAAKTGDIDMGMDYRLALTTSLQDSVNAGKLKLSLVPENGAEHLSINDCFDQQVKAPCGTKASYDPYSGDRTIRRAMLMAIDRQSIITKFLGGKTSIPADSWLYLGSDWIRNPSVPTTAYDPAKAKQQLDSAGYTSDPKCPTATGINGETVPGRKWKDGTCIHLSYVTEKGNPEREEVQPAVAAYLDEVGIHVDTPFANAPFAELFDDYPSGAVETHKVSMAMFTNESANPAEPDGLAYFYYHGNCGGSCPDANQISSDTLTEGQNTEGINDPTLDRLIDAEHSSVKISDRAKAFHDLQAELAKVLPDIPLYRQVMVVSYSPKLQGLKRFDIVPTFNEGEWSCTGGACQA